MAWCTSVVGGICHISLLRLFWGVFPYLQHYSFTCLLYVCRGFFSVFFCSCSFCNCNIFLLFVWCVFVVAPFPAFAAFRPLASAFTLWWRWCCCVESRALILAGMSINVFDCALGRRWQRSPEESFKHPCLVFFRELLGLSGSKVGYYCKNVWKLIIFIWINNIGAPPWNQGLCNQSHSKMLIIIYYFTFTKWVGTI